MYTHMHIHIYIYIYTHNLVAQARRPRSRRELRLPPLVGRRSESDDQIRISAYLSGKAAWWLQ